MPVCPLLFQSPTTGVQPALPNEKGAISGAPGLTELRRYQVPVPGSKMPMPAWPLPVQSPTTGTQPAAPYWKTRSGAPGLSLLRRYQVAVDGSKTPMPVWPVPVQSPTTETQPAAPYWNTRSGSPGLLLLRRYQLAVTGSNTPTASRQRSSSNSSAGRKRAIDRERRRPAARDCGQLSGDGNRSLFRRASGRWNNLLTFGKNDMSATSFWKQEGSRRQSSTRAFLNPTPVRGGQSYSSRRAHGRPAGRAPPQFPHRGRRNGGYLVLVVHGSFSLLRVKGNGWHAR
jgi:hypothetical protein